jgi:hypothetical protein
VATQEVEVTGDTRSDRIRAVSDNKRIGRIRAVSGNTGSDRIWAVSGEQEVTGYGLLQHKK